MLEALPGGQGYIFFNLRRCSSALYCGKMWSKCDEKWSLGKKAVSINDIFIKSMFFSLHHGDEVGKKGTLVLTIRGKKGLQLKNIYPWIYAVDDVIKAAVMTP